MNIMENRNIQSEPMTSIKSVVNESLMSRVQSEPTIRLENGNTIKKRKNVSFHRIEIREYQQTLGANPAVSCGLPLGLDWVYNSEHQVFDIEEYESKKPASRSNAELKIPQEERERKLREEWGVPRSDMQATRRKITIAKRQRRASVTNTLAMEQTIDFVNSAGRKLKQTFFMESNKDRRLRKALSTTTKRVKSMNDLHDVTAEANTNFDHEFKAYFNIGEEPTDSENEDWDFGLNEKLQFPLTR